MRKKFEFDRTGSRLEWNIDSQIILEGNREVEKLDAFYLNLKMGRWKMWIITWNIVFSCGKLGGMRLVLNGFNKHISRILFSESNLWNKAFWILSNFCGLIIWGLRRSAQFVSFYRECWHSVFQFKFIFCSNTRTNLIRFSTFGREAAYAS